MKHQSHFIFERRIHFYETDAMGVVHHSHYLRILEEARVAWLADRGLSHLHFPQANLCLAVIESGCRHYRAARFDDKIKIYVQVRQERLKIRMQYGIVPAKFDGTPEEIFGLQKVLTWGETVLIAVDRDLKVLRLPFELTKALEKEPWIEI